MAVLTAEHVQKSYGKTQALHDVSLELQQGEILALLGSNGSGKTTFIKTLATLLAKDAGKITILGYDIDRHPNEIRHLIGYVGQDTERSAYARLTVRENLEFFGRLRNLSKREIADRIEKLCDHFDFGGNMDKQFMQLSGGQKQTVVIIRALLHDPPLIYLDEPTKGLDPLISKKIRTYLQAYVAQEDKSMLLTSHIMTEVEELAHRVALIRKGSIPVVENPEVLKTSVGAKEFIEIRKDGLTEDVRAAILQQPSVLNQLERDADWVSFGVSDFFDGTEDILRVLREANLRLQIRHHQVTLEDAFIHQLGMLDERFEQ